jgi:CelD/BcsL family acetyltransferase involved in cellulose biosynthesis
MYVRKINIEEEVDALFAQWNLLLTQSAQKNIFLTPEWLMTWWRVMGQNGQLYLLAVEDENNQLMGLAPLMIQSKGWLSGMSIREISFLATDAACSDHLDFLSRRGKEEEVATAISRFLRENQQDWDMLNLSDLQANSPTLDILRREFAHDHIWREKEGAACPYLPLTGSWESYLAGKSSNFRQKVRYKRRRFQKQTGGRLVQCETSEQAIEALEQLFALNPARWQAKGEKSAFSKMTFQSFHREIAQLFLAKGWLDLAYLEVDDEIAAIIYNYNYKNKVFFYNTAFHPQWSKYGTGSILLAHSIEEAFEEGIEEYDFLRGAYSYKYEWTDSTRQNRKVMIIPRSAKMLLWHQMQVRSRQARTQGKLYLPDNIKGLLKRAVKRGK